MCKMGNLWGKDQRGLVKASSKRIRENGQESHGNHIEGIRYETDGILSPTLIVVVAPEVKIA